MQYTSEHWKPTRIMRAVESVATSTGCTRVVTDAGEAYCKPLGNRQGPCVLASEWVCVRLAHWLGLPTFVAAIIELDEEATFPLPEHKGHKYHAEAGPCFITKATPGERWDGTAESLRTVINIADIAKLVVFDTWVANRDRHHPDYNVRKPNVDNVFLVDAEDPAKPMVVAMDHSHCFGLKGGDELTRKLAESYERDDLLYGLFPQFIGLIQGEAVAAACQMLGTLAQGVVDPIISQVPTEWQVGVDAKTAWMAAIIKRAQRLSHSLMQQITNAAKCAGLV